MWNSGAKRLTNSVEQSPSWEANSSSVSPEIPSLFWTWRFITTFTTACHLSLSWATFIYLVHAFPSWFFKVQFSTILPSTLGSSKWSLSFRFPHQNFVCISLPRIHITCPTNLKNTAVMASAMYCLSLYWQISLFVWNSPLAGLNAIISNWRMLFTQFF